MNILIPDPLVKASRVNTINGSGIRNKEWQEQTQPKKLN